MKDGHYSGTDSVIKLPFSIFTNRNRLSLKISVISIGSSSTSNNSCPLIPSNLVMTFIMVRIEAVFRLCCFDCSTVFAVDFLRLRFHGKVNETHPEKDEDSLRLYNQYDFIVPFFLSDLLLS